MWFPRLCFLLNRLWQTKQKYFLTPMWNRLKMVQVWSLSLFSSVCLFTTGGVVEPSKLTLPDRCLCSFVSPEETQNSCGKRQGLTQLNVRSWGIGLLSDGYCNAKCFALKKLNLKNGVWPRPDMILELWLELEPGRTKVTTFQQVFSCPAAETPVVTSSRDVVRRRRRRSRRVAKVDSWIK